MKVQAVTAQLPEIIYKKPRTRFALNEQSISFLIDTYEENGEQKAKIFAMEGVGVHTYYKDVPYPIKSTVLPHIMASLNQVKVVIMETLKALKNPFILTGFIITREKRIESFNRIFDKFFGGHAIKYEYLCECAKAVEDFIYAITGNRELASNIAQIPQYDDAYRYRAQDLFTELDVEAFRDNPRKELKRLALILKTREKEGDVVFRKAEYVLFLLGLLLLIPKIRNLAKEHIYILKYGEFDDDDRYWVSIIENGYNYFGQVQEERGKNYKERPRAYRINT